ncbi:MAG: 3-phosphoshikimate 1-carboxyvinyltransferase [Coriobacteriia bacterium]|nr:3-phosphoshikimate 1-carboxyvinyltransferase [Coriobacteriia bacterium]MBS5478165.1 3-phosphoshikimate 1-carboxyvinyltransferase [Coriobacteriia bacterium]
MAHVVTATICPRPLSGEVPAIASKSAAHRMLVAAALADAPTEVRCATTSRDIEATCRCLGALGAVIERVPGGFHVQPIPRTDDGCVLEEHRYRVLDCDESGSTLRFMLPVSFALGADAIFMGSGRLPERPLSPLREQLEAHGCKMSPKGAWPLATEGRLEPGTFTLPGNVSSQFTTGLLLALPLVGSASTIVIQPPVESRPYVVMTTEVLAKFGVRVSNSVDGSIYEVTSSTPYRTPDIVNVEGDWSNAAFWLCAGALGSRSITVRNVDLGTEQGDLAVLDVLGQFGAHVRVHPGEGWATACGVDPQTGEPCQLRGTTIDAADIPDLVPVLSVVAACAEGDTRVINAGRLRIKESDRLATTHAMLAALGVGVEELDDGLIIHGCGGQAPLVVGEDGSLPACLSGNSVLSSHNDHRLAMAGAVAAIRADGPVTITDAQAVGKSYPGFFDDYRLLGGCVELDEHEFSVTR